MNKDVKSTEEKALLHSESKTVAVTPRERTGRSARKPMIDKGRLKVPGIPGYHLYWAATDKTDHSHNLQAFLDNWWEPVTRKELYGANCENPDEYVEAHDGAGLKLLKLPDELHEEDEKLRAAEAAKQMEKIKGAAASNHGGMKAVWE